MDNEFTKPVHSVYRMNIGGIVFEYGHVQPYRKALLCIRRGEPGERKEETNRCRD